MNTSLNQRTVVLSGSSLGSLTRPRSFAAFTMVEIALCLGVIAFALVAIIGVLPTGINVQKDNRQDTVLNQEGMLLLEAIRGGARGMDYLTNYFDSILISNINFAQATNYYNPADPVPPSAPNTSIAGVLTNGQRIVELLTYPKLILLANGRFTTNRVVARVRAITGSTVEKSKSARDIAFAYQVTSEVTPLDVHPAFSIDMVNTNSLTPQQFLERSNLWVLARNQAYNFEELRLTLQGPVVPKGAGYDVLGSPRVFRTVLSGYLGTRSGEGVLVQPSTFLKWQ